MSSLHPPTSVEPSIGYVYKDGLYLNTTSRCPSACRFCIKFSWEYKYRGYDLKLPKDPSIEKIFRELPADLQGFREVVYCGYGESTYRLADFPTLSSELRRRGARHIRLNTIGLGNLIHGRDIVPELSPYIDSISISLNTMDPQKYVDLVRPLPEYRDRALASAQDFCRSAARTITDTTVTSVDSPEFEPEKVEAFARSIGAKFRRRPYLDGYENA